MSRDTSTFSEVRNQVTVFLTRLGIRTKLILVFSLVLCSILFPLWLILQNQLAITARQQSEELGSLLTAKTAESLTELMNNTEKVSILVVLEELARSPSVSNAAVYDVDNQVVAETENSRPASLSNTYRFTTLIETEDSILGTLELTLQSHSFEQQSRNLQILFLGILVAGLIFIAVASVALSEHILAPVRRLLLAFQDPLQAGDMPESTREDEIREAEEVCMQMLASYQDHLQEENWRQEILQAWHKRNADVSLVYVEVANFDTSLSLLNPTAMIHLLDNYYRFIEAISEQYDGTFFQFSGRSLLIAFDRQRFTHPEHAAVCCCTLFQHLVERYNREQLAQAAPVLEFRTLIHSGSVLITRTGEQDSSRMALIGETSEEAQQLLADCPAAKVGMTADARRELAATLQLDFRPLNENDEENLRNQPVMLICSSMEQIDEELPELASDLVGELFGQVD